MNNREIFEELLKGQDNHVERTFPDLPSPITLRPLTSGELVELQILEKQGMAATLRMKNFGNLPRGERKKRIKEQVQDLESQLDFGQLRRAAAAVKHKAISYSASIPEEMVKELPAKLVDDIFEAVMEISNITEDDLDMLTDFRRLRGGEGPVGGPQ